MDRFEAYTENNLTNHEKNLHSSMDRFEGEHQSLTEEITRIYIPVWIDLKLEKLKNEIFANVFTFQYG